MSLSRLLIATSVTASALACTPADCSAKCVAPNCECVPFAWYWCEEKCLNSHHLDNCLCEWHKTSLTEHSYTYSRSAVLDIKLSADGSDLVVGQENGVFVSSDNGRQYHKVEAFAGLRSNVVAKSESVTLVGNNDGVWQSTNGITAERVSDVTGALKLELINSHAILSTTTGLYVSSSSGNEGTWNKVCDQTLISNCDTEVKFTKSSNAGELYLHFDGIATIFKFDLSTETITKHIESDMWCRSSPCSIWGLAAYDDGIAMTTKNGEVLSFNTETPLLGWRTLAKHPRSDNTEAQHIASDNGILLVQYDNVIVKYTSSSSSPALVVDALTADCDPVLDWGGNFRSASRLLTSSFTPSKDRNWIILSAGSAAYRVVYEH